VSLPLIFVYFQPGIKFIGYDGPPPNAKRRSGAPIHRHKSSPMPWDFKLPDDMFPHIKFGKECPKQYVPIPFKPCFYQLRIPRQVETSNIVSIINIRIISELRWYKDSL